MTRPTLAVGLLVACGGSQSTPPAPAPHASAPIAVNVDSGVDDAAPRVSSPTALDHSTLPCGDALATPPQTVKPGLWNINIVRMSDDALFIGASVQHMTATKDDETILGYLAANGAVTRIGDVGRGHKGRAFPGHGTVVIQTEPPAPTQPRVVLRPELAVCDVGATATLPEDPHAASGQLVGAFVDGASLTAVYVELGPHPSACRGLLSGVAPTRQIFVERLDLASRLVGWKTAASHNVDPPAPGAGCRSSVAIAAAASTASALVVLESCTEVDAGDSLSVSDCSLSAERFANGAWQHFALAAKHQSFVTPVASRDAERVAVPADRSEPTFQVYKLASGAFTSEGTLEGYPITIDSNKLARADSRGKPGPSGVGFRLFVDELGNGAWHTATDALETTGRNWAVDLSAAPTMVLSDEDATTLRLYTLALGKWRRVGLLDLQ